MEDRLYKFARLVDAGSFTKAAAAMHISQPALTTAIKKLERELKAELLVRDSHTFKLTAAGAIAYDTAKAIHTQGVNLKLRLAEAAADKVDLHLGLIDSIADMLFVHGDQLRQLERETHLSLTVDNSSRLIRYVEHDELDIALIAKPDELPASLMAIDLGDEPLVLVTHTSRQADAEQAIAHQQLTHFLSYNQQSQTYRLVQRHLDKHDIRTRPVFYSTSPEIMLQLVLAKRGTAVLPYLLVRPYIEKDQLHILQLGSNSVIPRTVVSIHRAGRTLPTQTTALLSRTREHLARLQADARMQ